jgi:hypothetical protein
MIGKPDSILQFAHFLKSRYGDVKIFASSRVSVNGKPPREMIDSRVDLAREERKLATYRWIRKSEKDEFLAELAPSCKALRSQAFVLFCQQISSEYNRILK